MQRRHTLRALLTVLLAAPWSGAAQTDRPAPPPRMDGPGLRNPFMTVPDAPEIGFPANRNDWAIYLGHFDSVTAADGYLRWIWQGWGAGLQGGAFRILELPAPGGGARFHAYAAGLSNGAARGVCLALPKTQPCAVTELDRGAFGLDDSPGFH